MKDVHAARVGAHTFWTAEDALKCAGLQEALVQPPASQFVQCAWLKLHMPRILCDMLGFVALVQ